MISAVMQQNAQGIQFVNDPVDRAGADMHAAKQHLAEHLVGTNAPHPRRMNDLQNPDARRGGPQASGTQALQR
ncbi:hypothetical protein D3C80_1855390 [compost metagenome]